jgi:hypothetical protein
MWFPWKGRKDQQASNHAQAKPGAPLKGTELIAEKADVLLAQHKELIENLWAFSQLDRDRYNQLYVGLFRNIASYVQHLPASESHHHAYLGGLLEHSLEVATFAGRIAGRFLYTADGEEQIAQWSALYTFAMVSGGALHDIGKIVTDIDVVLLTGDKKRRWIPQSGPIPVGTRYIYQYNAHRQHGLHEVAVLPLVFNLVPKAAIEWLWQKPRIRDEWLASIGGKAMDFGGNIGRCIIECDSQSTGSSMEHAPVAKAVEASDMSMAKKPKIHALAIKGIALSFRDFPPNTERNPYWVSQQFVACVCPRFVEILKAALGVEASYIPENSTLVYDAMADAGILIPNLTGRAVHTLMFAPGSKPLSVILIKREHIDPNNRLPVFSGQLICPSMPEELHHKLPGQAVTKGTISSSQQQAGTTTKINQERVPPARDERHLPKDANKNGQVKSAPVHPIDNKATSNNAQPVATNAQLNPKEATQNAINKDQRSEPEQRLNESNIIQPDASGTAIVAVNNALSCAEATPETDDGTVNYEMTVQVSNEDTFRNFVINNAQQDSGVTAHPIETNPSQLSSNTREQQKQKKPSYTGNQPSDRSQNASLFIEWLKAQVISGTLPVNARGGYLHVVDGNRLAMVSPAVFHSYFEFTGDDRLLGTQEIRQAIKSLQHALLGNFGFCRSPLGATMIQCEVIGARRKSGLVVMVFTPDATRGLNLPIDMSNKNVFINLLEIC